MMNKMKFSPEKVRKLRLETGWTIEQLGLRSGINPEYLGKMERGDRNITIQNAIKLSDALGCWLDELLL